MKASKIFLGVVGLTTLLRLLVIGWSGPAFEEAYYWNYAQHPQLSYFDHPPMVAWLIGVSTRLGTDHAFFIRLPAVLLFVGSSWVAYRLALATLGQKEADGTVILMACVPAFTLYSLAMTPDPPLLFLWGLGLYLGWQMVEQRRPWLWLGIGLCTGLAMLSKYTGALLPFGIFAYLAQRRDWKLLFCPQMALGAGLSWLVFSPVVIWNANNGWASFLFQGVERYGQATSVAERLGSWAFQAILWSPFGLVALVAALVWAWRRRENPGLLYLWWSCMPLLGLLSLVSLKRLVQINWPLPAYLPAAILVAAYWREGLEEGRHRGWVTATLLTTGFLSLIPYFGTLIPWAALNSIDTVHGWSEAAVRVDQERERHRASFVGGYGYEVASELAFHRRDPRHTLSRNLFCEIAKSYTFWQDVNDYRGQTGIIVAIPREPFDERLMTMYFDGYEKLEPLVVYRGGQPLREYALYVGHGYKGVTPGSQLRPAGKGYVSSPE
ncbi:MAG: ArnT family glycosyltransferase [Vulcanimicrobiota bacterium]